MMDRRFESFRKKRNCQYVNAGNQRFFVIEVKNHRRKKAPKNVRGALEDVPAGPSRGNTQRSSRHSEITRGKENLHFSVNEFRRILAEDLAANANDSHNKPLEINLADHYKKLKGVIGKMLGLTENRHVSRSIQADQNEGPSNSKRCNKTIMMSDIFRNAPKRPANVIPLSIECSTLHEDGTDSNVCNHPTSENFTCSLPNITLNPCNLSYQNAFFVNQTIHRNGFDSNYDDSSDIVSDEDDDGADSKSNNCVVKTIQAKRNVTGEEASPLRSANPHSNEKNQPWQKKQFSDFVNNLLSCISKEEPQDNASINSVQEFEKVFCEGGKVTTSNQAGPKEENSQVKSSHEPQKSLNFLKTHIQGLKQQSPDANPAKTLIEVFGAKSHITEIISNTLEQQKFLTRDSRFRTIRSEADKKENLKNELDEITKLPENEDQCFIQQERLTQIFDECTEDSSCKSFETAEFQIKSNNPFLCFKGNMISSDVITVNTNNIESRELLFTMQEHVAHIETHLIYLQDYLSDVKRDMVEHYKILEEQRDIVNQRKGGNNLEDAKVVYTIDCDKLCRTFSNLECTANANASNMEKIRKFSLRLDSKFIASVAFFVGFMCGDFVRK